MSKGYAAEVAVVAGKFNRGVEADEKISLEVKSILEKYRADGAVIVSDGEDDETILPVIQSRIPVISVQRVIIRIVEVLSIHTQCWAGILGCSFMIPSIQSSF